MNRNIIRLAVLAQALVAAAAASAADTFYQPRFELRAEHNDNFGLVPGGDPDSDVSGAVAEAELLADISTPRGTTTMRPRLRYQDFPDRDDLERVEGFFDLRSKYLWERSRFDLIANLSHQDLYNSETVGGDFDPTDPNGGSGSDSGEIVVGETRDELQLRPTFEHRLTERTNIGLGLEYRVARYDADQGAETKTDFDFGLGNAYLVWAVTPISDFSTGLYASRYEAKDGSEDTDAVGAEVGYAYRWSEQVGLEATLFFEENDITEFEPELVEETTSNFGGTFTAYRRHEVSEWSFSVGRTYVPTGDRGKSELDQIRLQYERQLSERLTFRGVGRYETRNSIGGTDGGVDRDYARADLSLKWLFTRTWYLSGGYSYMWEDREAAPTSGDNNKLFVTVGYQGIGREAR